MATLESESARKEVIERIGQLRPDLPPRWGLMNAHGMMCHLSDSYIACMGERPISKAPSLVPRAFMKWVALYTPVPWPKGVPTRPEVQQGAGGTRPTDFERDRAKLVDSIERFCRPGSPRAPHPMFGEMGPGAWMRWAYRHADHHLRQFGV